MKLKIKKRKVYDNQTYIKPESAFTEKQVDRNITKTNAPMKAICNISENTIAGAIQGVMILFILTVIFLIVYGNFML